MSYVLSLTSYFTVKRKRKFQQKILLLEMTVGGGGVGERAGAPLSLPPFLYGHELCYVFLEKTQTKNIIAIISYLL